MTYHARTGQKRSPATDKRKPGSITSQDIAAGAVKTQDLADDAVTSTKIQSGAILVRHLDEEVIDKLQLLKIPDGAIGTDLIADHSITHEKLAANSVTKDKLAANSVGFTELKNGNVTTIKIADGAVTPEKLSFVPAFRPLDPPVTSNEIFTGAVTDEKIEASVLALINGALQKSGGGMTGPLETVEDIAVLETAKGIILTSPNGTHYRIKVMDNGTLHTEIVT